MAQGRESKLELAFTIDAAADARGDSYRVFYSDENMLSKALRSKLGSGFQPSTYARR